MMFFKEIYRLFRNNIRSLALFELLYKGITLLVGLPFLYVLIQKGYEYAGIRYIANDIQKQVKEVAPLLGKGLGATCMTDRVCNEGRECCGLIDKLLEADKKDK